MLELLGAGATGAPALDTRIEAALAILRQAGVGYPTSSALARRVGCSVGRFRHLFRQQVGLAYRTYLLWLRLAAAVEVAHAGGTLTDAAHAAGFSDSAHLSRTHRRMFGVAPSALHHRP
jgi:AraC family transcriptional regulator